MYIGITYIYIIYIRTYILIESILTNPVNKGNMLSFQSFREGQTDYFFFNGIATRGQYMSFPKHQSVGYKNLFTKPFK